MTDSLDAGRLKAIELLLVMPTLGSVAEQAGISPSTLYRWMREPEFAAELDKCRRQVLNQTLAGITSVGKVALETLKELMQTGKSETIRAEAANAVLERLFQFDLALRVNEQSNNGGLSEASA